MRTHQFGGDWTEEKLELLRRYLIEYTKIFARNPKAQKLTTIYVDAFAGTGYRSSRTRKISHSALSPELLEADADEFLKGSARLALEVEPSFKQYVFIELGAKRVKELEKLKTEFPDKSESIKIVEAEANSYLKKWCARTDWQKCRAVVFLDPYGMQVEWSLIEAIAKTKAIDLWILFPLGVAVNRVLTRGEPPPLEWAQRLTLFFGTDEWQKAFYTRQTIQTLFGEEELQVKDADFDSIGKFFVERLKTVFTAVAETPRPLRNSRNVPLYLLCFAAGNPKGAPTALKIANHLLKKWQPKQK
jgi:three-Cys-motif partner protein